MSSNDDMNITQMILESASRIFTDYCNKEILDKAETGEFPEQLWSATQDNGFCDLGTADSGTSPRDVFSLLILCGQYALPLPLAEVLIARQLIPGIEGMSSVGIIENGSIVEVPWGRRADAIIGLDMENSKAAVVQQPQLLSESTNIAGEPRDTLALPENNQWISLESNPMEDLALARTCLLTGAMESILQMGIQYASERHQFGRPLAKFQVLQHKLAHAAVEVGAARMATDVAIASIGTPRALEQIATASARAGEAAQVVTDHVHQVHGAMGFTHEHTLHHYTRRAWAWRDEFGSEFDWQIKLGEAYAGASPDQIWDLITAA